MARQAGRADKKRGIATAHLSLVLAGTASTPGEWGFAACPCTKKCSIHGECLLCIAYHGRKGRPPCCEQ